MTWLPGSLAVVGTLPLLAGGAWARGWGFRHEVLPMVQAVVGG